MIEFLTSTQIIINTICLQSLQSGEIYFSGLKFNAVVLVISRSTGKSVYLKQKTKDEMTEWLRDSFYSKAQTAFISVFDANNLGIQTANCSVPFEILLQKL